MYRHFKVTILLLTSFACQANHKIIFLITQPRSLSTVFTRMMEERGDFTTFFEPTRGYFFCLNNTDPVDKYFTQKIVSSYKEIGDRIKEAAQLKDVFIKDTTVNINDFFHDQPHFMADPNVYFVFLIRNPHESSISAYRITPQYAVDPLWKQWLTYKSAVDLFLEMQAVSPNKPFCVVAEELYTDPKTTIEKFCRTVGIVYKPEALIWKNLEKDKEKIAEKRWIRSTNCGFHSPHKYERDEEENPTFNEIENLEHRNALKEIYEESLPYYRQMLAFNDASEKTLHSSFADDL